MTDMIELPRSKAEILALSARQSMSLAEVLMYTSRITDIGVKILDVGDLGAKGHRQIHILRGGAKCAESVHIETLRHWLKPGVPRPDGESTKRRRGSAVKAAEAARKACGNASHVRAHIGVLSDEENALCRQAAQLMAHMPANRAPYRDWVE